MTTQNHYYKKKFRSGRTRYLGFIQKDVLPFEFKRVYYLLMPSTALGEILYIKQDAVLIALSVVLVVSF
jgi:hypothetical protein